jgi:hypothetical protein
MLPDFTTEQTSCPKQASFHTLLSDTEMIGSFHLISSISLAAKTLRYASGNDFRAFSRMVLNSPSTACCSGSRVDELTVIPSARFCRKCNAVSQNRPLIFSPGYAAIPRV